MDILTWKNFIALDDTTPIDVAIKGINSLQTEFHQATEIIVKDGKRLGDEYLAISQDAKRLVEQLTAVNVNLKQSQDVIASSAKTTEKLADEAVKNTKAQDENKKAIENITKATTDLNKAKESLLKGQSTELGSLDALKKQLDSAAKSYAAMGAATSQAVKDEQLKKVAELNRQYTDTKKVLDEAKKSTTAAAGSYEALNQRVIAAKKELKAMEGGLDGNSKEFKRLQKEVSEGTKKLKAWDAEIGDNQRNVGDYKNQIGQLVPGFNNVSGAVEGTGKAFIALVANPIGATLIAIAAALGAVAAWFTRTETGGDALGKFMERLGAIFNLVMDQVARFGGVIFEALSKPQDLFNSLHKLAVDAKDAVIGFFKDPLPTIQEFGEFLVDQIVNRLTGVIDVFKNFGGAISNLISGDFSAFKESLTGIGNAALQIATGVEDVIGKVGNMMEESGINDLLKRADEIGKQIFDLKDVLEDQLAALILKRAQTELKVNELILKSQDKLKVSDEDRVRAIKQVTKESEALLAEEISAAQKKVDIQKKEIELRKLTLKDAEIPTKMVEELNQAEADLLALRSKRALEQKKLQKQEIAIIREIEMELITAVKREFDARTNLAKAQADIRAKELTAIATDTRNELDVRNSALREIAEQQKEQFEIAAEQQLNISKEAALARIELDADTLETIYNNETLTVAQRIELERSRKEELLSQDKAFVYESQRIQETLISQVDEANQKMLDAVTKNMFTQLQSDFNELSNDINAGSADALTALNEQFSEGNITLKEYEEQRREITANTNKQILLDTLDFLQKKADLLKQDRQDTSEVDNQIAQTRLKISQMTTDQVIQYEKDLAAAKKDLALTTRDTALSILSSQFEAEQQKLAVRLDDLTAKKDIELALAGDNEAKKAEILNEFAQKEQAIKKQQQEAARKQAIADKAIAVFTIGVNTAVAIGKAVAASPLTGGLPFSAIAAAIGALQIAAVLAKPIPAFAEGTTNAPGGLAIVNEEGRELIVDKQGNAKIINSDGPTLAEVAKGSTVYTAKETEQILNKPMTDQVVNGMRLDADSLTVISEQRHDKELAKVFRAGFESLDFTIKRSRSRSLTKEEITAAFRDALKSSSYLDSFR